MKRNLLSQAEHHSQPSTSSDTQEGKAELPSPIAAGLETDSENEEILEVEFEDVDEDTYGAGFAALVKDSYYFYHGSGHLAARATQLAASLFLQFITIGLQAALIYELQNLVSTRSLHHARRLYDQYEVEMYGANNTFRTVTGWRRGVGGMHGPHFKRENFEKLDPDFQAEVCSMPISQPLIFSIVLLIWTLVVMNNLKRCLELLHRLLWVTPTVSTGEMLAGERKDDITLIVGLPMMIKVLVLLIMGVPRVAMNCILLWRGTRWLASTMDFNELLLNAIALEFILLLKDLLYVVVMSERHKRETQKMKILPHTRRVGVDACKYVETYSWLGLAIGYVWLYFNVLLQFVLPDYNWDIHDTCVDYLKRVTAV